MYTDLFAKSPTLVKMSMVPIHNIFDITNVINQRKANVV